MARLRFITQRILLTVVALWAVATILFLLFRLAPGSPADYLILEGAGEEARQDVIERYGLDEPLHIQYLSYLASLVTGDLGRSFTYNRPVFGLLLERTLNTIVLMLTSVIIAFIVGPIIGAYLAWHRGETVDTVAIGGILTMYAAPVFWTGMLAIMLFSFQLNLVPSGGMYPVGATIEGPSDRFLTTDFIRHLALPLTVVTLYWLTAPTFLMRNNMVDVLGSGFIKMNRAQGLPERDIIYRHAARNSLLPVLHFAALAVGFAFGGSVVVETVFSWPGVGRLMWEAVQDQDYPLAQGAFLMLAFIIVMLNLFVDLVSVYVDPRVAEGEH